MKTDESQLDCQMGCVHYLANGPQETVSIGKSIRLFVRKSLGPTRVKMIKNYVNDLLNWYARLRGKPTKPPEPVVRTAAITLQSGDLVRVRSKDEIMATLNHWGQLKGCSFADEMAQYCGTTQRILKPVERFVDERDFRIRKTKGLVILDGIICHGTKSLGPCDRNCFYFWRVEWLEKLSQPDISVTAHSSSD